MAVEKKVPETDHLHPAEVEGVARVGCSLDREGTTTGQKALETEVKTTCKKVGKGLAEDWNDGRGYN